jgi:hypothetical protein
MQGKTSFYRGHMFCQPLVCWTPILIQPRHIEEGFSVKPAGKVGGRCEGLGHEGYDAGLVASKDLLAFEVAPVSHRREPVGSHRLTRLLGHLVQLISVTADVRDFVRDNQMMLGIDRRLHVVADDSGAFALACHRTRVGVG